MNLINNVKRTFFINEIELERVKSWSGNRHVTMYLPCYELENGVVVYPVAFPTGNGFDIYYERIDIEQPGDDA